MLCYYPNPAHKRLTTEAGPPLWRPDKSCCPDDMTLKEREELLRSSVSEDKDPQHPVRYAVRRTANGMEWFTTRLTRRHPDGRVEIHGFPFEPGHPKIPPSVLRQMRDAGIINQAEYRQVVRL
jgi:hypothetical protein